MNIYDRSSEAFKNYTPLPDAEKAWKNSMKLAAVLLTGCILAVGCMIARPGFFISYKGSLFLTLFVILISICAIPVFNFQNRSLMDLQLYHDYVFASYKKAAPIPASNALLTIASLNIIMGNAENARFAYEMIDASQLKFKSMPVYEKVKTYIVNSDSSSNETYTLENLTPRLYRRLRWSMFIVIFIVICNILLVSGLVYSSFFYLRIFLDGD